MPVAMRRPESRLGKDSWRRMMVDGAMGGRRCREGQTEDSLWRQHIRTGGMGERSRQAQGPQSMGCGQLEGCTRLREGAGLGREP